MVAVVLAAVVAAAAVSVFLVVSVLVERAEVRQALRRLDGYQVQAERDRELLPSLDDRVLAPLRSQFVRLGRRITPSGYVEGVAGKLAQAGKPAQGADSFVAAKAMAAVLVVVWFVVVFVLLGVDGVWGIVIWLTASIVGFVAPDAVLSRQADDRKQEMAKTLPDLLDLLTISTEAGLGFEQALDRTTTAIPGALSDEFDRMLAEMRLGTSRSEALRALDGRTDVPELRSFVLAMLQADAFGVSISRLLRGQADEMRLRRRQRAQEQAQKAPVKMLFPLAFCIFPSIFVIMLGPAMISLSENL